MDSFASPRRIIGLAVASVVLVIGLLSVGSLIEQVKADEIVVIQSLGGGLKVVTTPGPTWQGLGRVTTYKRRDIYEFDQAPIGFNDQGTGIVKGSLQFTMPVDREGVLKIHSVYPDQESVKAHIIQKSVDKVIYTTGALMSSRESYAEKKADLIRYVQDQVDLGVYRTRQTTARVADPITGQEKTETRVEIVIDVNNQPQRQESSIVGEFGIKASNFAIQSIDYSEQVDRQIQQQQTITMAVQTSMAEARQAEQRKLTVEMEGAMRAAEAKWQQEVVKAKLVTEAETRKAVAELDVQSAEAYKKATLLRADADSTYRRSVMSADGYMEKKIEALKNIHYNYAQAIQHTKSALVPTTVVGSAAGGSADNSIGGLVQIWMVQAAKQLGINLGGGGQ